MRYEWAANCGFAPGARELATHYLAGLPMRMFAERDVARTLGRYHRIFGLFGDLLAKVEAKAGVPAFASDAEFNLAVRWAESFCPVPSDRARRNPSGPAPR
jgi:hypothetical protein